MTSLMFFIQGSHNHMNLQQTTMGPSMAPHQPWITHPLQVQYMADFVPMIDPQIQPFPLWVMYQ